jgi:hypothetical protein
MSKTKTQLFLIHGGTTFKTRKNYLDFLKNRRISLENKLSWKDKYLDQKLGNLVEIIRPKMPLKDNAKYEDWKIHFEKYIPLLNNDMILIGNSLGGIFLAKYLSENKFPKKILSTYLICPPFDNSIKGEDLVGGFKLKRNLSLLEKNCQNLNLLFSKNDPVVPPSQENKYSNKLKEANIIIYNHIKGHFEIAEFPELVQMIKKDLTRK